MNDGRIDKYDTQTPRTTVRDRNENTAKKDRETDGHRDTRTNDAQADKHTTNRQLTASPGSIIK